MQKRTSKYMQAYVETHKEFKVYYSVNDLMKKAVQRCREKEYGLRKSLFEKDERLKMWIEKNFQDDMNWQNYGELWVLKHKNLLAAIRKGQDKDTLLDLQNWFPSIKGRRTTK